MVLGTMGGLMWPAITRMPVVAGRFPLMFALLSALVLALGKRFRGARDSGNLPASCRGRQQRLVASRSGLADSVSLSEGRVL
jgi:hypothetical protein